MCGSGLGHNFYSKPVVTTVPNYSVSLDNRHGKRSPLIPKTALA